MTIRGLSCWVVAIVLVVCTADSSARAQGVIFGTVQNSDLSNPPASELSWFGFLDGTDEEIRIEGNVGAGYDGLNWFDDFQNYTTEASGNVYDFVYVHPVRGEAFHLSGTIPDNSFQEENVVLAAAPVPPSPTNVSGQVVSPTRIDITWESEVGLSYHLYRRVSSNNGLYRRIDDPSGNLGNTGVSGSSFSDLTSDGVSEYVYLVIADDGASHYSAHSEPLAVDAAGPSCVCPCLGDQDCDGFLNAVDLNALIDALFFGGPSVQDSTCPVSRADLDCNASADAVDLNLMIDLLFFGGAVPCDPCIP